MFDRNLLEQFKTNRHERMATIGLVSLIVIGLITSRYIQKQNIKKEKTNTELVQLLEDYYANKPEEVKIPKNNYQSNPKKTWPKKENPEFKNESRFKNEVKHVLFPFDPNTIVYHDLIKLSFTSKQANTLLKFRASGFDFKSTEDLDKVHGLDQDLLDKVKPFVSIAEILQKDKVQDSTYSKPPLDSTLLITKEIDKPIEKIEINTATVEDLKSIYGIGKVYAGNLINYRDRLGGYIELPQLKEAYNFPDSIITILQKSIIVDSSYRTKININEVSFKELLAHPYISYEQNQILFPFIKGRRPIKDLGVLKEILVLDSSTINSLIPYLKLE